MRFTVHFMLLAIAVGAIAALSILMPGLLNPFAYAGYALSGALHALAVVGAIPADGKWRLRAGFVLGSVILSCLAPQAGMWVSHLAAGDSFLALIASTAAIGAFAYGLWLKVCWLRTLSLIAVGGVAAFCAAISGGVFMFGGAWGQLQAVLIACWWVAFSAGLFICTQVSARKNFASSMR